LHPQQPNDILAVRERRIFQSRRKSLSINVGDRLAASKLDKRGETAVWLLSTEDVVGVSSLGSDRGAIGERMRFAPLPSGLPLILTDKRSNHHESRHLRLAQMK
jgi:hypothetical protein